MWLVDPKIMCRRHLLGEHLETHMFHGTIKLKKALNGYIANGLLDTTVLQARHDALANEMLRRGYRHESPMTYRDRLGIRSVDIEHSLFDLLNRCPDCRARLSAEKAGNGS